MAVRARADCKGQKVGVVIVKDRRIISSGYNGTPEGNSATIRYSAGLRALVWNSLLLTDHAQLRAT